MNDFRYERKFLVDQLDTRQVMGLVKLHPSLFYEPYPPRYVNNLYLDTKDLENYFENVSGVAERRKARVRWYGELFQDIKKPALEFKIKDGFVGRKQIYPFASFVFDHNFNRGYFQGMLVQSEMPELVKEMVRPLDVVLCNRYHRRYFATKDQRFRLTIDEEMTFFQVKMTDNTFRHRFVDHNNIVVELKYAKPLDVIADRVAGFFPFIATKNSKYVTGIERVYL